MNVLDSYPRVNERFVNVSDIQEYVKQIQHCFGNRRDQEKLILAWVYNIVGDSQKERSCLHGVKLS